MTANKGYDPKVVASFSERMKDEGVSYLIEETDDNNDEYVQFKFVGKYEGKDVLYDAVIYTLRLHHNSELYEIAEHKAAQAFPEFKKILYQEDENGDLKQLDDLEEEIGLYMAEIMMEMEEEGTVKVKEHVDLDLNLDFGIGLDIGLNVEKITPGIIEKFITDFNEDSITLDETMYSFEMQGEEVA